MPLRRIGRRWIIVIACALVFVLLAGAPLLGPAMLGSENSTMRATGRALVRFRSKTYGVTANTLLACFDSVMASESSWAWQENEPLLRRLTQDLDEQERSRLCAGVSERVNEAHSQWEADAAIFAFGAAIPQAQLVTLFIDGDGRTREAVLVAWLDYPGDLTDGEKAVIVEDIVEAGLSTNDIDLVVRGIRLTNYWRIPQAIERFRPRLIPLKEDQRRHVRITVEIYFLLVKEHATTRPDADP